MKTRLTSFIPRAAITLLVMLLTSVSSWAETVNVGYKDADGTTKYVDATVLNNTMNDLAAGWYVVNSDVDYTSDVTNHGNLFTDGNGYVNIILCDGATLTANGLVFRGEDRLRIYGQSQGTGTANISTLMGNYSLTINGGTINANEIDCANGSVTINGGTVNVGRISPYGSVWLYGGNVTVTGEIKAGTSSDIVLGGATVKAGSYSAKQYVCISKGLTYYDGTGASYTGTEEFYEGFLNLTFTEIAAIAGKTLRTFDYRGGTCGDPNVNEGKNVTWLLNLNTKTLTISGTGPMMYYGSALGSDSKYHSTAPWSYLDSEIEKVIVGDGVTYIGSYAFAYCTALTSVSLPATVSALGDYVCYSSNVTRIDIPSTTAAATIGTGGFDYCPADLQIAVPSTLLGTYQTATNWSTYADNLVGVLSETTGFGTTFATGNYEYKRTFKCGVASTVCLPFSVTAAQTTPVGKFYSFAGIDKSGEKWEVIMEEATNKVTTDLTANTPYLFVPYIFDGKSKGDAVEFTFSGTVNPAGDAGYSVWTESGTGNEWAFQGVYYNYAWNEGNENLGKVYGFAAQSYDGVGYTVNPGDFVKAAAGASIAPFRAFLQYTPGNTNAPRRGAAENLPSRMTVRLVNADGTATEIESLTSDLRPQTSDNWYDLNGRCLSGKPTSKGMYIVNGRKVVIK